MRDLRSILYVPASRPGMLEKLPRITADAFILDLEDGVPPSEKASARDNLRETASSGQLPLARWMIRINPAATPWQSDDLELVETLRPHAVVLPKVEDPNESSALAARFARHGSATVVMIETARGVNVAAAIAASPNVQALIVGSADLRLSLGAVADSDRNWERHALSQILFAARANGIAAFDGVYFHVRDLDGLRAHAMVARDLGYDGKTCIHPDQVSVVRDVFSSAPAEIEWAQRVLSAWEAEDGAARGIIVVDGEMIESLHLAMAKRILERRSGE